MGENQAGARARGASVISCASLTPIRHRSLLSQVWSQFGICSQRKDPHAHPELCSHQRPLLRTPSMFAVLAAAARNAGGDGSQLQPKHPSCSFNANITDASGVESEPDKPCFLCSTSCYSGPATVSVTGAEAPRVVVWDTERGICPDGEMYIHYVSGAANREMTAGAGAEIHTYKACVFDTVPVSGTGCQTFSGDGCRVNLDDCSTHEWRVAREGSSCS